jgi:hypothetical protein
MAATKYIVDLLAFSPAPMFALLTRRANQAHTDNIAKDLQPAPVKSAAGFLLLGH